MASNRLVRIVRPGQVLRAGGVGAAVLALAASGTMENGERADGGWCPAEEQCADDTPEGLRFEGATLSWLWVGNGVSPIAVGGIQRIGLWDAVSDEPLAVPFKARMTDTVALAAAAGDGPEVLVSASAGGGGYLRISRVADDYLFDRLYVDSADVARVEAHPTTRTTYPSLAIGTEWAVLAGGSAEIGIALSSQAGSWLVDESMALTTPSESLRTGWDSLRITVPAGSRTYEVAVVTGGGFSAVAPVQVIDRIGEVRPMTYGGQYTVGTDTDACFRARTGSVDVYGVTWTFEVSGSAEPAPADEQTHDDCVRIRFVRTGSATVAARTAGFSTSVGYRAVTGSARVVAPDAPFAHTPGERAEAASAELDSLE